MSIDQVSSSPAIRFLQRGQQLLRLQAHILASMRRDTESKRDQFATLDIQIPVDAATFLAILKPNLEKSNTRWIDIPLMLQLFLARLADNFQTFLDELLRSIFIRQPDLLKRSDPVSVADVLSTAIEVRIQEPPRLAIHHELDDRRQIIGLLGCVLLFVGVFMPIVSVPVAGSMNYFKNGHGDGVLILILCFG